MSVFYGGKDTFLRKLSKLKISDGAFRTVKAIGPQRFKRLVEKNELHSEVWTKITKWVETLDVDNDDEFMIDDLHIDEVAEMVYCKSDCLEKAPKMVKGIMEALLEYYPEPWASDMFEEIIDDFLNEAVEFAGYAGLFD